MLLPFLIVISLVIKVLVNDANRVINVDNKNCYLEQEKVNNGTSLEVSVKKSSVRKNVVKLSAKPIEFKVKSDFLSPSFALNFNNGKKNSEIFKDIDGANRNYYISQDLKEYLFALLSYYSGDLQLAISKLKRLVNSTDQTVAQNSRRLLEVLKRIVIVREKFNNVNERFFTGQWLKK